jgi:hypothetical protein
MAFLDFFLARPARVPVAWNCSTSPEAYQQVNYPQMLRGSLWIFVDLCGSLWIFVDIDGDICGQLAADPTPSHTHTPADPTATALPLATPSPSPNTSINTIVTTPAQIKP